MKRFMTIVGLCVAISVESGLQACTIYFTNDTQDSVLLVNADGGQALSVGKGKRKAFGSNKEHANFHVLCKPKGMQKYSGVCTLKQYACSASKDINVAMSDVNRFKIDTTLFKVLKNGEEVGLALFDGKQSQ